MTILQVFFLIHIAESVEIETFSMFSIFKVLCHGDNRFPLGFQLPVISHCLFFRLFRSSKDNSRLGVTSKSLLF